MLYHRLSSKRRIRTQKAVIIEARALRERSEADVSEKEDLLSALDSLRGVLMLQWIVLMVMANRIFDFAGMLNEAGQFIGVVGWQVPAAIVLAALVAGGMLLGYIEFEPLRLSQPRHDDA